MTPTERRNLATSLRLRARDSDRDGVCEVLDAARGTGQLSEDEHRARLESAATARTLGDLDRLVRDLQVPRELSNAVPAPPRDRSMRWIAALGIAAVLTVGGAVVLTQSGEDAPSAAPGVAAVDAESSDLLTLTEMNRLFDTLEQKLGGLEVDELRVYPERADIVRPVPGKPGRSERYSYEIESGSPTFDGPDDGGTRTPTVPVDLAELRPNLPKLIGLVRGIEQSVAVPNPDSVHLSIDRDRSVDIPAVEILASNQDIAANGWLTIGFDGEILEVRRADQ
ncbi:DUF1707 SHOCT-like domain-containing protein [Rhodococcus sp. W8901]|uniref:DUF1707 SHOCT-like domain-containing protein n=1 Tax=Rhodococcus sp. W8901 TaxID=2742603 RepID=UPI001584418F|nr:DUF1707 domain-containing protein [Rhodococcus sp. W8901]QKT13762.1 DUF1707 domain-containing protein [Rhodococcus sp. W8901]